MGKYNFRVNSTGKIYGIKLPAGGTEAGAFAHYNAKYPGGITTVKEYKVTLLNVDGFCTYGKYLAKGESITYEDVISELNFKPGFRLFFAGAVSLSAMDLISEEFSNGLMNYSADCENITDVEIDHVLEVVQEQYPRLREIRAGQVIKVA